MNGCALLCVDSSIVLKPLFPTVKACQALRSHETHPECCCRAYPGRGFYVLGTCGHAHAWALQRADAEGHAARLNAAAEEREADAVDATAERSLFDGGAL